MINFHPIIDRIEALLQQDTEASIVYAALEARLALEKTVYDRLRQRHDYISHDQLKAWTPGQVVKRLLLEVDERMAETTVLSISREPYRPGIELVDKDYVEIGVEIGFNPKKIASLWQALSNLALHTRLPKDKDDDIPDYGEKLAIRAKVREVITELERLAQSTMTSSGVPTGGEVSCAAIVIFHVDRPDRQRAIDPRFAGLH